MHDFEERVAALRGEVASMGPRSKGRSYPQAIRSRAVLLAVAGTERGETVESVATLIGIPAWTIWRWMGAAKKSEIEAVKARVISGDGGEERESATPGNEEGSASSPAAPPPPVRAVRLSSGSSGKGTLLLHGPNGLWAEVTPATLADILRRLM